MRSFSSDIIISLGSARFKIDQPGQRGVAAEAVDSWMLAANGLVEFVKPEPRICIGEACPDKLSRMNQFSLRRPRFATLFLKPFGWTTWVHDTALSCFQRRILKSGAFSRVFHKHLHQRPQTGLILIPGRSFFNQAHGGRRWIQLATFDGNPLGGSLVSFSDGHTSSLCGSVRENGWGHCGLGAQTIQDEIKSTSL